MDHVFWKLGSINIGVVPVLKVIFPISSITNVTMYRDYV
jgi:hypothetical protein